MKIKISTLWIVVMFTMVFADILSFMSAGVLKQLLQFSETGAINQEILLLLAILLEIPIVMIYIARYWDYQYNRPANIVAAIVTILFVIGGGSWSLHYIFFASVEVCCMLLILWWAWHWKEELQV